MGIDLESRLLEPIQHLGMVPTRNLPVHKDLIDENIQVPPGDHARVQRSQGSGSGVARIGEQGLPVVLPLPIELLKGVQWQEHLPSHLDLLSSFASRLRAGT